MILVLCHTLGSQSVKVALGDKGLIPLAMREYGNVRFSDGDLRFE